MVTLGKNAEALRKAEDGRNEDARSVQQFSEYTCHKRTYSKQSVWCIQPERVDVLQLKVG